MANLPIAIRHVFLRRRIQVVDHGHYQGGPTKGGIFAVFQDRRLRLSKLRRPQASRLRRAGKRFVGVHFLFRVSRAIRVVRVALPASIRVDRATPVTIRRNIHSSDRVTFMRLAVVVCELVSNPVVVRFLFHPYPLGRAIPRGDDFSVNKVLRNCQPNVGNKEYRQGKAIHHMTSFHQMFLNVRCSFCLSTYHVSLRNRFRFIQGNGDASPRSLRFKGVHVRTEFRVLPYPWFLQHPSSLNCNGNAQRRRVFRVFKYLSVFNPNVNLRSRGVPTFLYHRQVHQSKVVTVRFLCQHVTSSDVQLYLQVNLVRVRVRVVTQHRRRVVPRPYQFSSAIFSPP